MSNFQVELENRLNSTLRSIKSTEKQLKNQWIRYCAFCNGPLGKEGRVALNTKKDIEFGLAHVGRLCETIEKEYAIIAEFNALLPKLTPQTYWVYQIESKEHLKQIIKERKTLEALYRRKIKSMRTLVDKMSFYGRS